MKLKLDITNCMGYLDAGSIEALKKRAAEARNTLLSHSGAGSEFTGWLDLCSGKNVEEIEQIKACAARIRSNSEVLVVIGIGGSYLGAKAGLDFIKSPNYNMLRKDAPDIYFAGNGLSSDAAFEILEMIGDRDFSVNVISKSGTTTEPAVAFRIFREKLEQKYGKAGASERIVATTDSARGALKSMADAEGWQTFVIPDDVGGRYSVLTPVGLLPLAAAGVDIDALLAGAASVLGTADSDENPALIYAAVRNGLYEQGKKIEIFADFEPALRYIGEWWKQLYGESEGKNGKGLFPASVDFTADLHSMGQYIQDGSRIILETFVKVEASDAELCVPYDADNLDGLNYLAGRTLTWANHQALAATEAAHLDGGVPNMRITVPVRNAESFGELAAFFELACGISGYMLGVNPFDQPGVEAYKKNMFRLLGKPGY